MEIITSVSVTLIAFVFNGWRENVYKTTCKMVSNTTETTECQISSNGSSTGPLCQGPILGSSKKYV